MQEIIELDVRGAKGRSGEAGRAFHGAEHSLLLLLFPFVAFEILVVQAVSSSPASHTGRSHGQDGCAAGQGAAVVTDGRGSGAAVGSGAGCVAGGGAGRTLPGGAISVSFFNSAEPIRAR